MTTLPLKRAYGIMFGNFDDPKAVHDCIFELACRVVRWFGPGGASTCLHVIEIACETARTAAPRGTQGNSQSIDLSC